MNLVERANLEWYQTSGPMVCWMAWHAETWIEDGFNMVSQAFPHAAALERFPDLWPNGVLKQEIRLCSRIRASEKILQIQNLKGIKY